MFPIENQNNWSIRAQIICRRSYNRPLDNNDVEFETWEQTVERVVRHQRWLWERAKGKDLNSVESAELEELKALILSRKGFLSGRTLWLGGTELSRLRESSQFNCSGTRIKTVFDIVDALWLLLQGVGVGFVPETGVLNGFMRPIPEIELIRSTRKFKGGAERNTETWFTDSKTWVLQIGDSAEAWAKAIGKIIAGKYPAKKLVLDLSQIRPAGDRLKGYGWISSGDEQLSKSLLGICTTMNAAAGRLLTIIDILDIMNWLGSILSSRRSAELALLSYDNSSWKEFALAKKNHYEENPQRGQSNNSLIFYNKPSKGQLFEIFDLMLEGGGSEPGFVNGAEALRRAPYFSSLNPCSEILLGDHSFCNLVEVVTSRFNRDFEGLCRAVYILSRANYRQTCVNLDDGVLQRTWHELNEYLHLCGVGLTGIVEWEDHKDANALKVLRKVAKNGANSMADELDLPHAALVTTIKPSGCRPWYGLTTTNHGIFTLKELFEDHQDMQDWSDFKKNIRVIQDNSVTQAITKTYYNGKKMVYRIHLTYNLVVDCTANHPWWVKSNENYPEVDGQWVKTQYLRLGDVIGTSLGIYQSSCPSKLQLIDPIVQMGIANIVYPIKMNIDLAWLCGFLWEYSFFERDVPHFVIIDNCLKNLEKIGYIMENQFNIDFNIKSLNNKGVILFLEFISTTFLYFFIKNDLFKHYTNTPQCAPKNIRTSATEHIISFIAGLLDFNGSVYLVKQELDGKHVNKKCVTINFKDSDFCQHVQDLAWSVGLGFERSDILENSGSNTIVFKQFTLILTSHCQENALTCFIKNSVKAQELDAKYKEGIWCNTTNCLNEKKVIGRVIGIKELGVMETFDISVENEPWFYAGGVKSHNTLAKIADCTEGVHKPLGRYIFNNINFSKFDPLVDLLKNAGYRVFENPYDSTGAVITFPVEYPNVEFSEIGGNFVNNESAVEQLERYKLLMDHYVDNNISTTISYLPGEIGQIIDWLHENWDHYVATAFMFRNDLTKTAEDLGYPYLPQEVVTEERFQDYVKGLQPIDLFNASGAFEIDSQECRTGMCPIK